MVDETREPLAAAIARLDDESYRELVAEAGGAALDSLLDGVRVAQRVLVANKAFGKGSRGPKKLALEQRLREVVALAASRSAVARTLAQGTTILEVRGGGPGTRLDVGALGGWAGLSTLDIREGGTVRGLGELAQVASLSVWASVIDLREIVRLPAVKIALDAPELASRDALATGPVVPELILTVHPDASLPSLRAALARLVPSDLMGGAPVRTVGPVTGEIHELQVHAGPTLERLELGRIGALECLRCTDTPRLEVFVGVEECRTLRTARLAGAFRSLEFLRGCPLEDLDVAAPVTDLSALAGMTTLRRLELSAEESADTFAKAPPLRLEHLGLCVPRSHVGKDVYAPWKEVLAGQRGLRSLSLRGHALESLFEVPDLPELEELDLSDCKGFLELGSMKTRFPRLRRLSVARTGLHKRDVTHLIKAGIDVV